MIALKLNNIDISSLIQWQSLSANQQLTSQVDTASFTYRKTDNKELIPATSDEIEIFDGDDKIFGGMIVSIAEQSDMSEGQVYSVTCQDYSYEFDSLLVAKSFTDKNGGEIIQELFAEYATEFDVSDVICNYPITRIVFNQIKLSECLERLSKIMDYEWYVDPNKKLFFFQRFSQEAPFELTDTNGNYVYKSLQRTIDGSLVSNQVKIRGGLGVESNLFEDIITVSGDDTKTFKLPYKFASLVEDNLIWLNTGGGYTQLDVGIDNVDSFDDYDVLYNYQMDMIRFENSLNDGDLIKFQGYKKFPVMAIASDEDSINTFGLREKLIRDSTIEDTVMARKRAMIELEIYKDNISDCNFRTYTKGLRTGMRLKVASDIRGISELDFIIDKISFRTRTPDEFEYNIHCSTARKYGLVEFLRNLFRGVVPDNFKEDEKEVAEIIKTDNQTINIEETIEAVSPKVDEEDVTIEETINNYDFEPDWVLADYIPQTPDDPKRNGLLSRTMTLY
jgi:hypothetical protein